MAKRLTRHNGRVGKSGVYKSTQDGDNPSARDDSGTPAPQGDKPSIRQAIRDFSPPAPVAAGAERDQRREEVL